MQIWILTDGRRSVNQLLHMICQGSDRREDARKALKFLVKRRLLYPLWGVFENIPKVRLVPEKQPNVKWRREFYDTVYVFDTSRVRNNPFYLLNNQYGRAWELIDGEKTLENLAEELQEEFGERAPMHKTFAFYGELAEQNLIRFKGLEDETHKAVAQKLRTYAARREGKTFSVIFMHNYLANWRVQKFTRHSGNTAPWFVTYELTYLCNLRCTHCYASDFDPRPQEDLSTEDAKHIVLDQVVGAGTHHLTFMGGEPMIRKDVYELIAYARKLGAFVKLQTSGTLLTTEAAKRLDEAGVNQVEVSIEGIDAKTNDLVRGRGSFKRAMEGIQNLAETKIPKKGICMTLMTNNFHQLDDVPQFAKELGVDEVFFSKFYVKGRGSKHPEWALTIEQREKLKRKIGGMQQEFPGMTLFAIWNCEAGNKWCAISPRGEVRPCTLHDQVVGDLKTEPFTKIWQESLVFDRMRRPYAYKKVCGGCNYKYQCLGTGCPARVWHNKREIIEEECVLKKYGER